MNEKKHRAFTAEFKQQAIELLKKGEKSAAELERDLGITPGLLGKWKTRYQIVVKEGQTTQIVPSEIEAVKAENRRLQRELANVEEEREILKKALVIFSKKNE
jgi:transposase